MIRPVAAALAAVMMLAFPVHAMAPSTDDSADQAKISDYAKAEALIDGLKLAVGEDGTLARYVPAFPKS